MENIKKSSVNSGVLLLILIAFLCTINAYYYYNAQETKNIKLHFNINKYDLIDIIDDNKNNHLMYVYELRDNMFVDITTTPASTIYLTIGYDNKMIISEEFYYQEESMESCTNNIKEYMQKHNQEKAFNTEIINKKYPYTLPYFESSSYFYLTDHDSIAEFKCQMLLDKIIFKVKFLPVYYLNAKNNISGIEGYSFGNQIFNGEANEAMIIKGEDNSEITLLLNEKKEIASIEKIRIFNSKELCHKEFEKQKNIMKKNYNFITDFSVENIESYIDDRYVVLNTCTQNKENLFEYRYSVSDSFYNKYFYWVLKLMTVEKLYGFTKSN